MTGERESLWESRRRNEVERAFALYCAEENLTEDAEAPHGQAFYAGYEMGREDEYHTYLLEQRDVKGCTGTSLPAPCSCRRHARCLACIEADGLTRPK